MRYSEDTLKSWSSPLSEAENQRVKNTISMIESALSAHVGMRSLKYKVILQGSYANNTNVRQNSDVDICVMLTSSFEAEYVYGYTDKDYGYLSGGTSYYTFKQYVIEALRNKFGYSVVSVGNKCINIGDNTYHVNADVVPAYQYRNYKALNSRDPNRFVEGILFYAADGTKIINYPEVHKENGIEKNIQTKYQYKKLVRMIKNIRNKMADDKKVNENAITSFLIECLIWNVPNNYITGSNTWNETIQNTIACLYTEMNKGNYTNWTEVSKMFPLFRSGQKWSVNDVSSFLLDMYSYLGYV